MEAKKQNKGFFTRFIAVIHYLAIGVAALILAFVFSSNRVVMIAMLLVAIVNFFLAIQYFAIARLMHKEEVKLSDHPKLKNLQFGKNHHGNESSREELQDLNDKIGVLPEALENRELISHKLWEEKAV